MKSYDVAVVGGGFAGLTLAKYTSSLGLDTVVLEKKKRVGSEIKTTGLLPYGFSYMGLDDIPEGFLTNDIKNWFFHFPNDKQAFVRNKRLGAFMTYPGKVLRFLANGASSEGADIKENSKVTSFDKYNGNIFVNFENGDKKNRLKSGYVVGADGVFSTVARKFSLSQNNKYLVSLEKTYSEVEGLSKNCFHFFIDSDVFPGYGGWIVPRGEDVLVGLAVYPNKCNIQRSMDVLEGKLEDMFDFKKSDVVGKRSGVIPVNGNLENVASNDAMLVGDAAGHTGALMGDGICRATGYAKFASEVVYEIVVNKNYKAVSQYEGICKNDLYNRLNLLYRKMYENFNSGGKMKSVGNFLNEQNFLDGNKKRSYAFFDTLFKVFKYPMFFPYLFSAAFKMVYFPLKNNFRDIFRGRFELTR